MPDRDQELMVLVANGDRGAFTELMRNHEDMVFAVCLRTMGDREAALDAVQETFLTLFRKADRYRADAKVSTWLYRVAVNTCLDLLRKAKRRPSEPLSDDFEHADARAGDPFEAVELRPELERAMAQIPEEFRTVLILGDMHGLSVAEVAEILEIPDGTVKSRLSRGRRHLASVLGNLDAPSEHQRDDDA